MSECDHPSRGLLVIAAFKLLKGLALLAVGIGAHTLIDKDLAAVVEALGKCFSRRPQQPLPAGAAGTIHGLESPAAEGSELWHIFYSALLLTEGVDWHWANGGQNILRSSRHRRSFAGDYEIFHHPNIMKVVVLLINAAVVGYLVLELRRCRDPNGN